MSQGTPHPPRSDDSPPHATAPPVDPSRKCLEGWHCCHFFYRFRHEVLAARSPSDRLEASQQLTDLLQPQNAGVERLQVWITSGHRADFALLVMDPDPLRVDSVHQRILHSSLGRALEPTYSFVSITEVSEYLPTAADYAAKLESEGMVRGSEMFEARVRAYAAREPEMRRQRLTPDLPDWPACCFYPMNKKRKVGENWFLLPFAERAALMSEHARSGMAFAGRVSQLITVAVGLDDWEWGVTLWAARPEFLKEIVYRMRFDEASARYAEFGPFYVGYVATPDELCKHCHLT